MDTTFAMGMFFTILGIYLLIIGLGIAGYIMHSLSFYTIAKRRGISKPWIAWIPLVKDWIMGSIADEYDNRNGIKRKWRVVLLVLLIISVVSVVAMYVGMFVYILYINQNTGVITDEFLGFVIPFYAFAIVMSLVMQAFGICRSICIYKIYESTVPEKSIKYLLLSLIVPLGKSVCLIKCRNKGYSVSEEIIPEEPVLFEIVQPEDEQ